MRSLTTNVLEPLALDKPPTLNLRIPTPAAKSTWNPPDIFKTLL